MIDLGDDEAVVRDLLNANDPSQPERYPRLAWLFQPKERVFHSSFCRDGASSMSSASFRSFFKVCSSISLLARTPLAMLRRSPTMSGCSRFSIGEVDFLVEEALKIRADRMEVDS